MATVEDTTDYVIQRVVEEKIDLSMLKLQKLLYYIQAWNLVHYRQPIFEAQFQAWVHGPVCRSVYDRFVDTHSLYSSVSFKDIREDFNPENLTEEERQLVNSVLDAYAGFSCTQLEEMTHTEQPWQEARKGYAPAARCEVEINQNTMQNFYRARLVNDESKLKFSNRVNTCLFTGVYLAGVTFGIVFHDLNPIMIAILSVCFSLIALIRT